jgi:V/A-type H+-transporting ATPase subunit I
MPGQSYPEAELVSELEGKIDELEKLILNRHETLNSTESELATLETRIAELEPFADLGIPFDLYHGYNSIACFVGTTREKLDDKIDKITPDYHFVHGTEPKGVYALFVPAEASEGIEGLLRNAGYNPERVPEETGDPIALVGGCKERISRLKANREKLREEIEKSKDQSRAFLCAAEEYLRVQLEKAEAPLQFTCSENAFVIDFWIPSEIFDSLSKKLTSDVGGDLHITKLETKGADHHGEKENAEEPPTVYNNPKGVRGFETLINMFTTPKHDEIDPTPVITFGFPIMFGFMIGDLGYGIILMLIGLILACGPRFDRGIKTMGWFLITGGFCAAIFGLIMFADFMGIPFSGHGTTWNSLLGLNIGWAGIFHKVNGEDIKSMLTLTILGGCIYMLIGYILGIINEIAHGIKHALVKAGFFLILSGFGVLLLSFDAEQNFSAVGASIVKSLPFLGSMGTVIALMIPGLFLVLAGDPMEVLEFVGPFANMISFARLAAIGVAKGFLVGAFNDLGIPMLREGGGWLALGVFVLIAAHLMVLILGFLSAFIQSLRLNYYEMFMKFVKGGGTAYNPFGWIPKFIKASPEK